MNALEAALIAAIAALIIIGLAPRLVPAAARLAAQIACADDETICVAAADDERSEVEPRRRKR